jgi:tetratricopeptide (TPR) repeat protein
MLTVFLEISMNNSTKCRLTVLAIWLVLAAGCGLNQVSHETPASRQAFNDAFTEWSSGHQTEAEAMLITDVQRYPQDQHLAFFQAACVRSRFQMDQSTPLFQAVQKINPYSPDGQCAQFVLAMDANQGAGANYECLQEDSNENPNDVLILWMYAVEARAAESHSQGQAKESAGEDGLAAFQKLLTLIHGDAPVLIHQTYANLLDDANEPQKALPERLIAVRQEPAPWSYGGLALTLSRLGRHAESDKVLTEARQLFPAANLPAHD